MPPPPPPPPPPLLSAPANLKPLDEKPADRNALLSEIRGGTKLKKSTTNDKSAPVISGKKNTAFEKQPTSAGNLNSINSLKNGPLSMGDLFSQGMPKLRSTNKAFMEGGKYKSQLNPRLVVSSTSSKSGNGVLGGNGGCALKTNSCLNSTSQKKSDEIRQNGLNGTDFADSKVTTSGTISKTKFSGTESKPIRPMLPTGQKPSISSLKFGQVNEGDSNKLSGSNPEFLHEIVNINKPKLPSKHSVSMSTLMAKPNTQTINENSLEKQNAYDSSDVPEKLDYLNNKLSHCFNVKKDNDWGGSVPDLVNKVPTKPNSLIKPPVRGANLSLSTSALASRPVPPDTKGKLTEDLSSSEIPNSKPKQSINNLPPKMSSEPSHLSKTQNSLSNQPKPPARQNRRERCKPKPNVAPPPIPTRSPQQISTSSLTKSQPSLPPPPPPPRSTSQPNIVDAKHPLSHPKHRSEPKMLNGPNGKKGLEEIFFLKFHIPSEFPKPGPYTRVTKIYPSKSAKNRKPNSQRHHRPTAVPPPPPSISS